MSTEVKLPELGESVTEGTITAWLVEVGDKVEADQPLFELSSDKIDTEVPAPVAGILTEIKVQVDETVDVGTVVAIIGEANADAGRHEAAEPESATAEPQAEAEPAAAEAAAEEPQAEAAAGAGAEQLEATGAEEAEAAPPEAAEGTGAEAAEAEEPQAVQEAPGPMSPLVRRLVAEHNLDASQIAGSGKGGRITRDDVDAAVRHRDEQPAAASASAPASQPEPKAQRQPQRQRVPSGKRPTETPPQAPQPSERPPMKAGARTRVQELSRIRRRIAAKMMESLQSSAQLTTVQEADVTGIMRLRAQRKDDFRDREGVSLSPFVFLCRAAVLALRSHPAVNALADWDAGQVTYHDYVNLGIAVDTEKGLIVPNIKGADDLSLAGLARAVNTAAAKARGRAEGGGRLEIADLEGGTFTMTNTGSRGVLIDTPILNYPEVAILGTGMIKARPVVVEDGSGPAIAIRDMVYLSLTYDHRLIDGADAARFVTAVKEVVETHDWAAEIG